MADVLISTPKQWESLARAKQNNTVSKEDRFFIEHDMIAEFSLWAIKRSTVEGFIKGIAVGLAAAAAIAVVVRLVS
jgi:hypothetical protein